MKNNQSLYQTSTHFHRNLAKCSSTCDRHSKKKKKKEPLKPIQVNKIGLQQKQVTLKGWGWAGFFEVAGSIPLIPLRYLFEKCADSHTRAEKGTVSGKMTVFNFQLCCEGGEKWRSERKDRQGN